MTVSDDWQDLVDAAQAIMEAHDRDRWVLGDLAARVERRYGESSLKAYADAIACRSSTLYDYHRVSLFYEPEHREQFPALTWSHYREAMRAGNLAAALAWLIQAHDNTWPIAEMHRQMNGVLGKPIPPQKLIECQARIIQPGRVVISFELPPADCQVLSRLFYGGRQTVRLVVFALPQAGEQGAGAIADGSAARATG